MDIAALKQLIKDGESEVVEFKESWPMNAAISKVVCGFANNRGGTLVIGVNDAGRAVGISPDKLDPLQKRVVESVRTVEPNPLVSISVVNVYKCDVVVVQVKKAHDRVYHTYQGAIYVRVGSTNQRLDGATQLDYLRHKQILSFDEAVHDHAVLTDIDENKVRKYLESRGRDDFLDDRTLEDFLKVNRLAEEGSQGTRIKNPALVLFGKNPADFHPQTEVKLVHFAGSTPVDILDYKLLNSDIISNIDNALLFLRSKLAKRIEINDSAKREESYEYPLSVIREALINAFIHRNYFSNDSIQISLFSDKLEIVSPGSLPSELTKELFGTLSVQRNPILYRFLRDLGYVEGLGTGVPRIRQEMAKANLPEPEFEFTDHFTRIRLHKYPTAPKVELQTIPGISPRHQKALDFLAQQGEMKAKQYADMNKVSYATAVNEINTLIQLGLIEKVGAYRGAYYVLTNS